MLNAVTKVQEKVETLQTQLAESNEKLDLILEAILNLSTEDTTQQPAVSAPIVGLDPEKWMDIAMTTKGWHEDNHTEKLMAYFRQGGFEWDPRGDENAWCGAFVRATLVQAGMLAIDSLKAKDWKQYGQPCDEKFGAIVAGNSHVAFCLGGGELIGGNQGDMVKVGNIEWYISNPVYRWPIG